MMAWGLELNGRLTKEEMRDLLRLHFHGWRHGAVTNAYLLHVSELHICLLFRFSSAAMMQHYISKKLGIATPGNVSHLVSGCSANNLGTLAQWCSEKMIAASPASGANVARFNMLLSALGVDWAQLMQLDSETYWKHGAVSLQANLGEKCTLWDGIEHMQAQERTIAGGMAADGAAAATARGADMLSTTADARAGARAAGPGAEFTVSYSTSHYPSELVEAMSAKLAAEATAKQAFSGSTKE